MAIGKIKPTVTIAAQFVAGVEVEAIKREGKLYLPVMNLGDFAIEDVTPTKKEVKAPFVEKAEEKAKAETKAPVVEAEEEEGDIVLFTEEELAEFPTTDLRAMLDEMGINPDDTEGRNTNKKLRTLVLGHQEEYAEKLAAEEGIEVVSPEEADEVVSGDEEMSEEEATNEVIAILEEFDAGKFTFKKVVSTLMDMTDGASEKNVSKVIKDFEEDAEATLEDTAAIIIEVLQGATPKAAAKAVEAEEEFVEASDLKKGDKVSVYWADEKEWFDGEVLSVRRGKVNVEYEDETSEVLDDNNTKIKLLS